MRASVRKALLAASAAMFVAAMTTTVAHAGITLATTGGAAAGTPDPNYTLVSTPYSGVGNNPFNFPTSAYVTTSLAGSWAAPVAGTNWVTPGPPGNAATEGLPTGYQSPGVYTPYDFQTKFTSATALAGELFSLTYAADDTIAILLNGTLVHTASIGGGGEFTKLYNTTFTGNILSGTNTVDFLVYNTGQPPLQVTGGNDGPVGLLVTSFTATAVPEPSTVVMLFSGAAFGLVAFRRRKRIAA